MMLAARDVVDAFRELGLSMEVLGKYCAVRCVIWLVMILEDTPPEEEE